MNANDFINNREISTLIWIIILFIWVMTQKAVRKSFFHLIKTIFSRKLLILFSTMFLYIIIMVIISMIIRFWDITAIKDTLIWTFGSAVVILMKISNTKDTTLQFKDAVIENIKLIVILEFILNLYSFPLIIELILVPIVTLIYLMDILVKDKKEYKNIIPILEGTLGIFGLVVIAFTIISIFGDVQEFINFKNIRDFLLPIVFTLGYLPFVYIWALIMDYESFFIRLYIEGNNSQLRNYAKRMTILKCNINLSKINRLSHKIGLLRVAEKDDIIKLIEGV